MCRSAHKSRSYTCAGFLLFHSSAEGIRILPALSAEGALNAVQESLRQLHLILIRVQKRVLLLR